MGMLGNYNDSCNRLSRALRPRLHGPEPGRPSLSPRKDGTTAPVALRLKKLDGIFFGYLECKGKQFVAVRAEYSGHDVFVRTPIPLKPSRHTDRKGFGPNSSRFGDGSAEHLLADMIASNPQESGLRAIAAKLGWSTHAAR
jgi:hypothetical protein